MDKISNLHSLPKLEHTDACDKYTEFKLLSLHFIGS